MPWDPPLVCPLTHAPLRREGDWLLSDGQGLRLGLIVAPEVQVDPSERGADARFDLGFGGQLFELCGGSVQRLAQGVVKLGVTRVAGDFRIDGREHAVEKTRGQLGLPRLATNLPLCR